MTSGYEWLAQIESQQRGGSRGGGALKGHGHAILSRVPAALSSSAVMSRMLLFLWVQGLSHVSNTPRETCEKTPKGKHQQALREVATSQAACVPWPECLDKGCLGHIGNDGLVQP